MSSVGVAGLERVGSILLPLRRLGGELMAGNSSLITHHS
jgi:hypothetical protein